MLPRSRQPCRIRLTQIFSVRPPKRFQSANKSSQLNPCRIFVAPETIGVFTRASHGYRGRSTPYRPPGGTFAIRSLQRGDRVGFGQTPERNRSSTAGCDCHRYSFAGTSAVLLRVEGTTPDNPEWVRRKRNIVRRFFRSSYAIGLLVKQEKMNLDALDPRDYAAHGGSFPILLPGTGCVGTITVSGLPQRQDHCLVVETVAEFLGRDISDIALAPA